MRPLVPTLAAALLLGGCYDSSFGGKGCGDAAPPVTTTIRDVQRQLEGQGVPVTGDIVVAGRVTTSDRSENFYRTLCIEDDGAGMEIMAGLDHLHNDYPIGTRLTVRLQGLALGRHYGVLQAGRPPAPGSGYATDYIGSRPALDKAVVRGCEAPEAPEPVRCTLAELTEDRCGTLVRIDGLYYTPEDLSTGSWAGYKRFTDRQGRALYTYVRTYASFAGEEVPVGECSLVGILQYDDAGEGRYLIKLRDENDCLR